MYIYLEFQTLVFLFVFNGSSLSTLDLIIIDDDHYRNAYTYTNTYYFDQQRFIIVHSKKETEQVNYVHTPYCNIIIVEYKMNPIKLCHWSLSIYMICLGDRSDLLCSVSLFFFCKHKCLLRCLMYFEFVCMPSCFFFRLISLDPITSHFLFFFG